MKTLYHECHFGFGDNIYEMPFVVGMAEKYDRVYVRTPFPQLYWIQSTDKFKFLPGRSRLNTQEKSIESFSGWSGEPDLSAFDIERSDFWSGTREFLPVPDRFLRDSGLKSVNFTLPIRPDWAAKALFALEGYNPHNLPICLIKRPTLRKEWFCPARNPYIEYFQAIIDHLKGKYFFVSVASLRENEEWLDGCLTGIDLKLHNGEIDIWTLIGLASQCSLAICCPSFFIPLSLAIGMRCFCIYGGSGDPAWHVSDLIDRPAYGFAAPDPFCACGKMEHDCNKAIDGVMERFEAFMKASENA